MYTAEQLIQHIFSADFDFSATALEVFRFQYNYNSVYQKFVEALGINVQSIKKPEQIPFLPVRFFKTHEIATTSFMPQTVFESSGTTETINSRHLIKDTGLYEQSFTTTFEEFYGNISEWCIIGLLPSYLERENSSLVYMVNRLVQISEHPLSGFYLNEMDTLSETLQALEQQGQKTLLIGVTFALLDFAQFHPMPLKNVTIMETGGMKGRRKEMIRIEVHDLLQQAFHIDQIHSEYGMTELLSQAYSTGNGLFKTPPYLKILIRDDEDPLTVSSATRNKQRGMVNIIDLANIYSCSFIATDDLGTLYPDESFEIIGRHDHSDLRGCSLLAL